MKKILESIKHFFDCDIESWKMTGNHENRYDTPFDVLPVRWEEFICSSGKTHWLPFGNYSDLLWEKRIYELKVEIAEEWRKRGNIDKAIEVLKSK